VTDRLGRVGVFARAMIWLTNGHRFGAGRFKFDLEYSFCCFRFDLHTVVNAGYIRCYIAKALIRFAFSAVFYWCVCLISVCCIFCIFCRYIRW